MMVNRIKYFWLLIIIPFQVFSQVPQGQSQYVLPSSSKTESENLEAKLLRGDSLLIHENKTEGEKLFLEVAAFYQSKNDLENEALTWFRLGTKIQRHPANRPSNIKYLQKSAELFHLAGDIENEAKAKNTLADVFYISGRYIIADLEASEALALYQSIGYKQLSDCYYMLSVINRYKGDLNKSLIYATKAVQNAEELAAANIDIIYGEMALVYSEIGKVEESVYWYRKTLDKRRSNKTDHTIILRTAGLLIRQLIKQKKVGEAITLIGEIERENPPVTTIEKASLNQIKAYCFDALNQFAKTEMYFLQMQKNYEETTFRDEYISIGYTDIGKFYLKYHQFAKARQYLAKALQPVDVMTATNTMDVLLSLFKADSAMGNYYQAVNDLQQYDLLKDSVFNTKKAQQIEELQIQYETARKEKEILALNGQNKTQKAALRSTVLTRNVIIVVVLLLFGFFYYRYRLKQKINRQLTDQQKIINQKNTSLENLVREKDWLVKEIHHRVKNNFHMVQGLLGTQSGYLKSEEALNALTDSRNRVQAMSLIHQKLYQSDNLSAINMAAYIHELVNYLSASFNIGNTIQFRMEIDPVELDLTHCIPLGLILNEAITNSIKYAFSTQQSKIITIGFKRERQNKIMLSIKDNGAGMPADFNFQKASSMGMKLMRGLSEDIEAVFSVRSDSGTEIQLNFIYEPTERVTLPGKPALTNSL